MESLQSRFWMDVPRVLEPGGWKSPESFPVASHCLYEDLVGLLDAATDEALWSINSSHWNYINLIDSHHGIIAVLAQQRSNWSFASGSWLHKKYITARTSDFNFFSP